MQVRSVIVTIVASTCALVVGCDDDFPKPDLDLARDVRAGSPAACVRTSAWIKFYLDRAMWDRDPMDVQRPDHGEIKVSVDTPGLIGVTPGEAVVCDVRVMVGEGDGIVTRLQPYQIALGDDFGPDFARFRFTGSGILPDYARMRSAFSGGPVEWAAETLPCSADSPNAEPLLPASQSQAHRIASLIRARMQWEHETFGKALFLPAWAFDRVEGVKWFGSAKISDDSFLFGAVCGPAGCDKEAFSFLVDRGQTAGQRDTNGIPTGVLRTRGDATSRYVYQAFGHTRSSYETCAFNALSEVERFQPGTPPVTLP